MQFKINNVIWEIKKVNNDEMNEIASKYRNVEQYEYYRGYTSYVENVIYLNTINEIDMEYVLRHELIHAYLYSIGMYNLESYSEEDVCDIASRSAYVVNEIVENYFDKER